MAMYKNREVYIAGTVEQEKPAKVFVVAVGDPEANREIANKSDVVVFDKEEVPEHRIVKKDEDKTEKKDDWRMGYATPTEEQVKIHENNMKLRQVQAEKKDEVVEFKPARDADLRPTQPVVQPKSSMTTVKK